MHRILKVEERLSGLPKVDLNVVSDLEIGPGDALVVAAGFEDRAVEVFNRTIEQGNRGFKVIVIDYAPIIDSNKLEEITRACKSKTISYSILTYDRRAPAGIGDQVINHTDQDVNRIFIDVSAMSRLLIVQLISAFGTSHLGLEKINVLYSEAMKYPPDEAHFKSEVRKRNENGFYRALFLSWGVYEVISVPELSSITFPGQLTRLIAFPSFNVDQLAAICAEIQPHYISLIHGKPPLPENAWRLDAIKELNCTNFPYAKQCEDFYTSTLDYYQTFQAILGIYSKNSLLDKIVVAPTGSKMQAVSIGLIKCFFEDVHVVYPITRTFAPPNQYTEGVRNVYQLPLKTMHLNSLVSATKI